MNRTLTTFFEHLSVRRALPLLVLLGVWMGGCAEKQGEKAPGDSADTSAADTGLSPLPPDSGTYSVTTTPEGRTELPTWNTSAPNLFIDLPKGFAVRADSGLDYDVVFVYRRDDPGVEDTTLPAMALMQIVLSERSIGTSVPSRKVGTRKSMIGTYPALWHRYRDTTVTKWEYRQNVLEIPRYFASLDPEKEAGNLNLWLYVAGRDTAAVEQLMRAAGTLGIAP